MTELTLVTSRIATLKSWIRWHEAQLNGIQCANMHPEDREELWDHYDSLIQSLKTKVKDLEASL